MTAPKSDKVPKAMEARFAEIVANPWMQPMTTPADDPFAQIHPKVHEGVRKSGLIRGHLSEGIFHRRMWDLDEP